jgi:hypothetical protein
MVLKIRDWCGFGNEITNGSRPENCTFIKKHEGTQSQN